MQKINKKQLLLPSLLTLLPAAVSLALYAQPSVLTAPWGFEGTVPMMAVMVFQPLALLGMLWLCAWITGKDPGNQGRNQKVSRMMLWTIPVISNLVFAMYCAILLGSAKAVPRLIPIFLGLIFAVIGNFMPKTKRNSTIGVKVCWALQSDENWNATHRFTGRLWFACGIGLMALTCLPEKVGLPILTVLIFLLAFAPMVYSYCYYRKQRRAGTVPQADASRDIRFTKWTVVFLIALLAFVGIVMFAGDISFTCGEDALQITADFYSDMTLPYSAIDSVTYRETDDRGIRSFGYGSARLLMGAFENDEFGLYTRYSYTGCHSCVVVTSGNKILVLSGRNDAETRGLYEDLSARVTQGGTK